MIDPDEWVAVARSLASDPVHTETALRRAVSTLYYALFHALAGFAADRMIAPTDSSAAYALVYRGLDHRKIRDACVDVGKPTLRAAVQEALRRSAVGTDLKAFADVLVPLQQLRHLADYHPFVDLTRPDVLSLADDVEAALTRFRAVDRSELTDFTTYVLLGGRAS